MAAPFDRILVYGAGHVGCYLGGRLQGRSWVGPVVRGGLPQRSRLVPPVRYLVRPPRLEAMREHGLTLSDGRGYLRELPGAALDLHTDPAAALADVRVVLITVKSAATAQVAATLAMHLSPDACVVSFQNGLRNADLLRAALPRHRVLAGMVPFNVVEHAPGAFHQASSGRLMIEATGRREFWFDFFRQAGLPLQVRTDMPAVQRAKLLLNLNNAINALSGLPLREELAQRDWRRCLALAQREALRAFAAARQPLARITPLPAHWLPRVLELPDGVFRRVAGRILAIDPAARSSMWDDLQAGRASEVDFIQGEVVELARAHGGGAAVNARLQSLLHQAERQRRDWSAAQLLAELRAA